MTTERFQNLDLYIADAEGPALSTEQDALDLLGETYGSGADLIVVPASRFAPEFFDLSTRKAGFFFQKMQNYQARLVILGDISAHVSNKQSARGFHRRNQPNRPSLVRARPGRDGEQAPAKDVTQKILLPIADKFWARR